jgi:hypothetical protein
VIFRTAGDRRDFVARVAAVSDDAGLTVLAWALLPNHGHLSHLCDIEKRRKVVSPEQAARFATSLGRSQQQFVRLALQGLVDETGLKMKVDVAAV